MKALKYLAVLAVLVVINANAASVVCKKDGRYWYPANELSKKIASSLGVKTCNGKRFKAVVKGLKGTSNVVSAKKSMSTEQVIKSLSK